MASLVQVVVRNKGPCEMASSVGCFEDVCFCPEIELDKTPSFSVAPFLSADPAVICLIRQDQTWDKLDGGFFLSHYCCQAVWTFLPCIFRIVQRTLKTGKNSVKPEWYFFSLIHSEKNHFTQKQGNKAALPLSKNIIFSPLFCITALNEKWFCCLSGW